MFIETEMISSHKIEGGKFFQILLKKALDSTGFLPVLVPFSQFVITTSITVQRASTIIPTGKNENITWIIIN